MSTLTWPFILSWSLYILINVTTSQDMSKAEIQKTGKVLFRALRNSDCKIDCSNRKRRPVCGSDGVLYNSRCALKRAKRCENRRIKIKPKSFCSASATPSTKCLQERAQAQEIARRPTVGIFIPECKRDGMFAEVQCHAATGYCWCVTKDGIPVKGTSISGKRPACTRNKQGRNNKKRRSERKSKRKPRRGRVCKISDRRDFNRNLVKAFKLEYQRARAADSILPANAGRKEIGMLNNSLEKRVVEWKFNSLDKNHDNKLRRKEVRALKRMVKKVIRPRACARNFAKYCDIDQNKKIERKEWSTCLGVDTQSDSQLKGKNGDSSDTFNTTEEQTQVPTDSTDTEDKPKIITNFPPSRGGVERSTSGLITPSIPEPTSEKEDNSRSCRDERNAAILEHKEAPDGGTFIPVCTENGKWARAQCHESSQYCWCVDENRGVPIPGTSTFKVKPTCDIHTDREMKGCPLTKKRVFLADLFEKLATEMDNYAKTGSDPSKMPDLSSGKTTQEKAANWLFKILDVNSNNVLERRELKPFRKLIPKKKDTRKCSRNFIRYCDADSNRKVTNEEWVDCMGLKHNGGLPLHHRKGPNPFSSVLKPS